MPNAHRLRISGYWILLPSSADIYHDPSDDPSVIGGIVVVDTFRTRPTDPLPVSRKVRGQSRLEFNYDTSDDRWPALGIYYSVSRRCW